MYHFIIALQTIRNPARIHRYDPPALDLVAYLNACRPDRFYISAVFHNTGFDEPQG